MAYIPVWSLERQAQNIAGRDFNSGIHRPCHAICIECGVPYNFGIWMVI